MIRKLLEIFTKEYREETRYREFLKKKILTFPMRDNSESVDIRMRRLIDKGYVSPCKVKVGDY